MQPFFLCRGGKRTLADVGDEADASTRNGLEYLGSEDVRRVEADIDYFGGRGCVLRNGCTVDVEADGEGELADAEEIAPALGGGGGADGRAEDVGKAGDRLVVEGEEEHLLKVVVGNGHLRIGIGGGGGGAAVGREAEAQHHFDGAELCGIGHIAETHLVDVDKHARPEDGGTLHFELAEVLVDIAEVGVALPIGEVGDEGAQGKEEVCGGRCHVNWF